jgi:hypothetical protein
MVKTKFKYTMLLLLMVTSLAIDGSENPVGKTTSFEFSQCDDLRHLAEGHEVVALAPSVTTGIVKKKVENPGRVYFSNQDSIKKTLISALYTCKPLTSTHPDHATNSYLFYPKDCLHFTHGCVTPSQALLAQSLQETAALQKEFGKDLIPDGSRAHRFNSSDGGDFNGFVVATTSHISFHTLKSACTSDQKTD